MPWSNGTYTRTNGVFSGATVWAQDNAAGTNITTGHHDTHDQDLATGLNNCATVDGTNKMVADLKPNADAAYNLGSATLRWNQAYFGGLITLSGALNEAKTTLASNSSVTIGAAGGNYINVTGTSTIKAFDVAQAGTRRLLEFSGALTLQQNATSLILPGAANIITASGDAAEFTSEGSGNWRLTRYLTASGPPSCGPASATIGNVPVFATVVGRRLSDSGVSLTALQGQVPSGAMMTYAGSSAPAGWLLCYGQAVSRAVYSSLFSAIGTTYGTGDGSTTFNLPDMRGRVAAGVDNMGGSAANRITNGNSGITGTTLGASGGDERFYQHNHGTTESPHDHTSSVWDTNGTGSGPLISSFTAGTNEHNITTSSVSTGLTINNAGNGNSQNVQPTMMLNHIIKT